MSTITALPTPPSRDDPVNFADEADDFLGALPNFGAEANALALDLTNKSSVVDTKHSEVLVKATEAENSAISASNSATIAANAVASLPDGTINDATTSNTTVWSSNKVSQELASKVSLTSNETLTNKTLITPDVTYGVQAIAVNTTAVRSKTYVLTASLTLTLPASPGPGDWVSFANRSGTATPVIARNGQNIMGLAENMTVNNNKYFGTLVYADATRGWIFQ